VCHFVIESRIGVLAVKKTMFWFWIKGNG